jgi:hypothetical protein
MVSRGIDQTTISLWPEYSQSAIFGRNSRRRLSRSGVHAASPGQIAHYRHSRLGYFRYPRSSLHAQAEERRHYHFNAFCRFASMRRWAQGRNECSTHGVVFN